MMRSTPAPPVEWPYRSLEQGRIVVQGEPAAWMGGVYQQFFGSLTEKDYALTPVANVQELEEFHSNERVSYPYDQGNQHFFSGDNFDSALVLTDPAIPLQLDDDQTIADYAAIQRNSTRVTL